MSSIEDRLRGAYQEAAATVPPASLRDVPAAGPGSRLTAPGRPAPRRRRRLLAPVAAAAAVTAIAVTAVAVPQLRSGHGSGATGAASPGLARPAGFFTAIGPHGDLLVYSAATGRQTADVGPFGRHTALTVAAATAGTDHHPVFIVASTSTASCGSSQLLSLTLDATGKPNSVASVPVPRIAGPVSALASTPDGKTIAYASAPCVQGAQAPGQIGVVHTNGAPSRHWGWNPDPGQSVGSLSITADGKTIEYAASPNKISGPGSGQVLPVRQIRLLPTGAPPGTAAQRSRVAVSIPRTAPGSEFTSGLIAPGGQAVYFCTEQGQFSGHPAETLRAYDVASGMTYVLRSFGRTQGQGCLLGASAGELLIVRDITRTPSRVDRLDLRTGRLTPVPVRQAVDEGNGSVPW
jgi:hypothetical protein